MVLCAKDRKTRKQKVSVRSAFVTPVFAKLSVVPQRFSKVTCLIVFSAVAIPPHDFLQRDNVRVQFLQDLRDALGSNSTVQSAALMNIICSDTEPELIPGLFIMVMHLFPLEY